MNGKPYGAAMAVALIVAAAQQVEDTKEHDEDQEA